MDNISSVLEKELALLDVFELSDEGELTPLDSKTLLPAVELEVLEGGDGYKDSDGYEEADKGKSIEAQALDENELENDTGLELETKEQVINDAKPETVSQEIPPEDEGKVETKELEDKIERELEVGFETAEEDGEEDKEEKEEKREEVGEVSEKGKWEKEEEKYEEKDEEQRERLIKVGDTYISDNLLKEKDDLEYKFGSFFENYSLHDVIFKNKDSTFLNTKDIEEVHQKLLFLIEEGCTLNETTFSYLSLYYFLTYRYYECIRLIERHIEHFSNLDIFYNMLGNCFYLISSKDRASIYFRKATEVNGSFSTAYFALSYVYFESGDYRGSLSCLLEAQKDFYNSPDFILLMGECYEQLGSIKKALAYYEQYLKVRKEIAIMQKVAELFYKRGDFNKSLYYFDRFKTIELEDLPYIQHLDYKLSVSNFFINDRKKALEHISLVIKESEPVFIEEEGAKGESEQLLVLFEKAFSLDIYDIHSFEIFNILTNELNMSFPSFLINSLKVEESTNTDMLLSIAHLYLKKKKFKTSIHFLKRILGKNPRHTGALISVSKTYYKHSKDKNKAYDIFLFLENKQKTDGEIDSYLGKYYFERELYDKAVAVLQQALDKEVINFTSLFYLAKSYYKLENEKKAIEYLQKTYNLKTIPNQKEHIELMILLGKLYINSNEYKKGINILKKVLEIDDSIKEAHMYLAAAYKKLLEAKYKEHYYKYIDP